MSIIQGNAHTSAGGGYQIERSLRFNSADSAYLNRTPGSASNRKTWTWSGWVKRSKLGAQQGLIACPVGTSDSTYMNLQFNSGDSLGLGLYTQYVLLTTQVFRDASAWYHIVVSFDTTNATANNRCRMYVNGVEITTFTTRNNPTLNADYGINAASQHDIGRSEYTNSTCLGGYLTEVNFIDGQALTPSSFGETDSATGVWKPKAYSGTYGTNGFYLPFKTASQWSGYFDGTGDKLTSSTNAIAATGQFSVEAWVYQIARTVTSDQHIFSQYTSGATSGRWYLRFNGTVIAFTSGLGSVNGATTVNTGTWYHVCVTRDSGDRIRVFLNGVLDGTAVVSGSLDTAASVIGATQTANYWHGYISNVRAVSGEIPTAYQTASTTVGATIFTPSTSQLTAVSGTSLLTCQSSTFIDNSGLGRTITTTGDVITQQFSPFTLDVTDDHSGQGNNWIPNNLDLRTTGAGADILVDSPTSYGTDTGVGGTVRGNYATLNPLNKNSAITLANGNLDFSASNNRFVTSTIAVSSGKWYWEFVPANGSTGASGIGVIRASDNVFGTDGFAAAGSYVGVGYLNNGQKSISGTRTSYGATYTTNDVIGVALDLDSGTQTITFYKNNSSQGSINLPSAGQTWIVATDYSESGTHVTNFGQRAFAYTAPSGFKALCTQNLPTPTIGATSTTQANDYFDTVLYTGTSATQNITSLGFQPDWVWIKIRNQAYSHNTYDAVRGANKRLRQNQTGAEATVTDQLMSFDSNGFTLGADSGAEVNSSGNTFVAWNWKANGAGSSNTAGTITSTVSANTTSGFSIVTYTGTGSNATVGHGLGVAPSMIIIKRTNSTNSWQVYHSNANASPASGGLFLNTTDAFTALSTTWNSTVPASTVFSIGTAAGTNASGGTYVAYCFAPVAGYSAFGSYTGNGSTDGPMIFTGFRPRYVMVKRTDASGNEWEIRDTARDSYNSGTSARLWASSSASELNDFPADILSNGFKPRSTGTNSNGSGATYIYMAFAETPFKYSLGR